MDAFWTDEQDLTDAEQKRIKPDKEFESDNPDGAAESIQSAAQIEFDEPLRSAIEDRAEAIQTIDNDPDKPDRYEDDVYVSQRRAEQALKASALRGLGAAQSTRGVDSSVQWALARVDDFAKTVKTGDPDDAEFVSDNDLLPFGHPRRTVEDAESPFVEGVPEDTEQRDKVEGFLSTKL